MQEYEPAEIVKRDYYSSNIMHEHTSLTGIYSTAERRINLLAIWTKYHFSESSFMEARLFHKDFLIYITCEVCYDPERQTYGSRRFDFANQKEPKKRPECRFKLRRNKMSHVHVFDHPLILHKLSIMRDKNTGSKQFRELLNEIAMLMVYEVTRDLPTKEIEIETPLCKATVRTLSGKKIGLIPILRAGLGMVEGVTNLIPTAKIGHIGLYRDPETLKPVEYYCKLPADAAERELFILEPMVATGGSAADGISFLKDRGCTSIRLVSLIAAPEGIEYLQKMHPDVDIYVAAVDEGLNEHAYIMPGLGDAGDRIFGTR
jgi:uracil phosphoribosyltransferase